MPAGADLFAEDAGAAFFQFFEDAFLAGDELLARGEVLQQLEVRRPLVVHRQGAHEGWVGARGGFWGAEILLQDGDELCGKDGCVQQRLHQFAEAAFPGIAMRLDLVFMRVPHQQVGKFMDKGDEEGVAIEGLVHADAVSFSLPRVPIIAQLGSPPAGEGELHAVLHQEGCRVRQSLLRHKRTQGVFELVL